MIRWIVYLAMALTAEVVAMLTCWIWPWFARVRYGAINNAHEKACEPRLPAGLCWFDTPDNSLLGDRAHKARHAHSSDYWQMTCWLARNRAYGFKWGPLAAPMDVEGQQITGDPTINRNNSHFGTLRITMGPYWQYKLVKRIANTGYGWMVNLGWLLDDTSQQRALFLFSPRLVRLK